MNKLNKTLLLSKTLKIDKYYYPFNKDKDFTLIQLCENVNIFLPRFCYHSELSIAGNCRMCLVEISNSNKPVVACATSLTEGLVVKTNTILIKIIRESILEFLLINHPLDCPICDQGGECDLQDLLVVYGSDRGRFKESKRSVLDKEFGVMIKTIMTRCIHCTRCVRFSSELLGQPYLGAFGRGDSTEIGTYIKRVVDGNLVGNLIDLCPVGAITSKPYAFRARPWELCKTETIDILDSLCSSIRVDTKHNLILRVIPSINPKINDCWITDKIRFSYDSVTNQRLLSPLVLDNESNVVGQSWEHAFFKVKEVLTQKSNYRGVYVFTGYLLDIFTSYSAYYFFSKLGFIKFNIYNINSYNKNDFRNNYIFNTQLRDIYNYNLFLITSLSLNEEFPLISLKLRKLNLLNRKNIKINYIGNNFDNSLNNILHLGLTDELNTMIYIGKSFFSKTIINNISLYIISGDINLNNIMSENYFFLRLGNLLRIDFVYNYLSLFTNEIHSKELGSFSIRNNTNLFSIFYKPKVLYLVGFDKKPNFESLDKNITVIYQGHTGSFSAEISNIILPTTLFFEKSSIFINSEGRLLKSTSALQPAGSSWTDELVFYALIKYLTGKNILYSNWYDLYFTRVPFSNNFFNMISTSNNISLNILFSFFTQNRHIKYNISRVINFYDLDILSKNSNNIYKCAQKTNKKTYLKGNFLL